LRNSSVSANSSRQTSTSSIHLLVRPADGGVSRGPRHAGREPGDIDSDNPRSPTPDRHGVPCSHPIPRPARGAGLNRCMARQVARTRATRFQLRCRSHRLGRGRNSCRGLSALHGAGLPQRFQQVRIRSTSDRRGHARSDLAPCRCQARQPAQRATASTRCVRTSRPTRNSHASAHQRPPP